VLAGGKGSRELEGRLPTGCVWWAPSRKGMVGGPSQKSLPFLLGILTQWNGSGGEVPDVERSCSSGAQTSGDTQLNSGLGAVAQPPTWCGRLGVFPERPGGASCKLPPHEAGEEGQPT
jgi:hypothetical protein